MNAANTSSSSERIFLLFPSLNRGLRALWLIIAKLTEQTPSLMGGPSPSCSEPFSGHGYRTCSFSINCQAGSLLVVDHWIPWSYAPVPSFLKYSVSILWFPSGFIDTSLKLYFLQLALTSRAQTPLSISKIWVSSSAILYHFGKQSFLEVSPCSVTRGGFPSLIWDIHSDLLCDLPFSNSHGSADIALSSSVGHKPLL